MAMCSCIIPMHMACICDASADVIPAIGIEPARACAIITGAGELSAREAAKP